MRPGPQGKGCPAAKQRDQETVSSAASSLAGWGLRGCPFTSACATRAPPPRSARQITQKTAQHLAHPGHSGASATAGALGEPWGGGPRAEARARPPSGPPGAAPSHTPRPLGPAKRRAHRPTWGRTGSRIRRRIGRRAANQRAPSAAAATIGRREPAGEGAGLPFVLSSSAPPSPPPGPRRPGPPTRSPGRGRRGARGGCRPPPDVLPEWPFRGLGLPQPPACSRAGERSNRLIRSLCRV